MPSVMELTQGKGLEYASEVAVCAAIAQEFRRSNLGSGVFVPEQFKSPKIAKGIRNWNVELEFTFPIEPQTRL